MAFQMKFAVLGKTLLIVIIYFLTITISFASTSSTLETKISAISSDINSILIKDESIHGTLENQLQEIQLLRNEITKQSSEIFYLKGRLDNPQIVSSQNSSGPSNWMALAVLLAALIAAVVAIYNQSKQAKLQMLLKAVELIMDSRNGYQAKMRMRNLKPFLDDNIKEHLSEDLEHFDGPEYTALRVSFAQSISDKAKDCSEVEAIWKKHLHHTGIWK